MPEVAPPFDEFGFHGEIAATYNLAPPELRARRTSVDVGDGQQVSAIVWGDTPPELVLLHGGNQNAHTWDTMLLALGRPAVAIDLPGHGHSDWRADKDYWPRRNADAVATVMAELAPSPTVVVGMSLGGLTGIVLAARRPDLVPRLIVVDVTPGVRSTLEANGDDRDQDAVNGATVFESWDALLARTISYFPHRNVDGLRRGLLLNAMGRDDGTWVWRHDALTEPGEKSPDFDVLWDDVSAITAPTMLVRGGNSIHTSEADVATFRERCPQLRVAVVPAAGHTVQGDQPIALASLVHAFALQDAVTQPA